MDSLKWYAVESGIISRKKWNDIWGSYGQLGVFSCPNYFRVFRTIAAMGRVYCENQNIKSRIRLEQLLSFLDWLFRISANYVFQESFALCQTSHTNLVIFAWPVFIGMEPTNGSKPLSSVPSLRPGIKTTKRWFPSRLGVSGNPAACRLSSLKRVPGIVGKLSPWRCSAPTTTEDIKKTKLPRTGKDKAQTFSSLFLRSVSPLLTYTRSVIL